VPSLLEERHKEVKSHHDVLTDLVITHVLAAGGNAHARNLTQLELHGGLDVLEREDKRLVLAHGGGEHLNSGKNRSDDDGHLLQDGIGSNENIVLLGPLFNELLVLVELFEFIKTGDSNVDIIVFDLSLVLLISDQADLKSGAGQVGESDATDETFVLLGIVILKAELDFDSLSELTFLSLGAHLGDGFGYHSVVDLCGHRYFC
jgi:hypothetical protein